jgi:hypothetical protein
MRTLLRRAARLPSSRLFRAGDERWIGVQANFHEWNTTTSSTNDSMQDEEPGERHPADPAQAPPRAKV